MVGAGRKAGPAVIMNQETISKIAAELDAAMRGRKFGKIFGLSALRLVIDFRLQDNRFLLISCEPGSSRAHLVTRRTRDLEKSSGTVGQFILGLRKRLSGATVESVEKLESERAISVRLTNENDLGESESFTLLVQLTGKSSNLFLLDSRGNVLDRIRATSGDGQEVGDAYRPPERPAARGAEPDDPFVRAAEASLSETIDSFYLEREAREAFDSRVRAAKARVSKEISKRRALIKKLEGDLEAHGDPEEWKHKAEVLLANVSDAKRVGGGFLVKDYFSDSLPEIEVEADENESVTQAAERCFKRYAKARNARQQIAERMKEIASQLEALAARSDVIEKAAQEGDEGFFTEPEAVKARGRDKGPKAQSKIAGVRTFVSSDGLTILVGKGSKDNDNLTFKVAKSFDTWLHAADYPGSHVVIRATDRSGEIPQRTLLEAAQLAAFYSDARHQGKAAVNYTLKKFVNKPRGAAPGLVSLSGFKTVLVEPKVPEELSSE